MTDRLLEALAGSRRPAIVGLAKNAGKTTVLNALIAGLAARGKHPGIASIGRDGEHIDIITLQPKPRIVIPPGCSFASTSRAAGERFRLLEELGGRGVLGMPGVYRNDGPEALEVELVGVNRVAAMRLALERLELYGSPVLVDGALDRRSHGSPTLCDGIVLATGAVVGNTVDLIVRRSMEQVALLKLPLAGELRTELTPEHHFVKVDGALTDRKCQHYLRGGFRGILTVADWTKIFISEAMTNTIASRGILLALESRVPLLAITVNPHNPHGRDLDSGEIISALQSAPPLQSLSPDLPVVDVISEV